MVPHLSHNERSQQAVLRRHVRQRREGGIRVAPVQSFRHVGAQRVGRHFGVQGLWENIN